MLVEYQSIFLIEKRIRFLATFLLSLAFLTLVPELFLFVQAEPLPVPDDIRFQSVFAADSQRVWAVGDMGCVRCTSDGGKTWEIQFLPKTDRLIPPSLSDVFFLDSNRGWIVGKQYGYGRQGTLGVIYQTHDGGKNWFSLDVRIPGPLFCVRFLDARRGLVAGQPSEQNPSGVFVTSDSGKTWSPLALTADSIAQTWIGLDHSASCGFALSSRSGSLAVVKTFESAIQAKGLFHGNYLAALTMSGEAQSLFGAGRDGMVLQSPDFGVSWNWQDMPRAASGFDFLAAASAGNRIVLAGRPGNRLFLGDLKSKTWTTVATPDCAPVRDLTFADEKNGWAVGSLGRILATSDGGSTWVMQQAGGKRAAILAFFPSVEQIPWEVLASFSVQQRAIVVLEVIGSRPSILDPCCPSDSELLQAAALRSGVTESVLWTGFPLCGQNDSFPTAFETLGNVVASSGKRDKSGKTVAVAGLHSASPLNQDRINDLWNAENDGRAGVLLRQKLVRELRLWQPELVLIQEPDPRAEAGAEKLLQEAVLDSVQLAGDPLAYSEQIADAGLNAWKTPEILAITSPELEADWQLSVNQSVALLQGTLLSAGQASRRILRPELSPVVFDKIRLKRITPLAAGSNAAFQGNPALSGSPLSGVLSGSAHSTATQKMSALAGSIRLSPHDNQREYRDFWSKDESRLESQIRMTSNTVAMINQPTGIFQNNPAALVSYVGRLVNDLTESQAVGILEDLSSQFRQTGQSGLAAEIDYLIFSRYGTHPGSDQAAVRLVRYYCSLEIQVSEKNQAPYLPPDTAYQMAQSRSQLAVLFATQLRSAKPSVFEQGETRRIISSLERRTGQGTSRNWAASAVNSGFYDAQTILAAQTELWLTRQADSPVLPLINALRTDRAPYLDGTLDELFWKQGKPVLLTGDSGAFRVPASVLFAWDGKFLYLGAEIPKQPGIIYSENKQARTWDADIAESDQFNLILDTDRDFSVAFRLASDYKGRPNDSCGENRDWNPRWFIASKINSNSWSLEWAIPWNELLPQPPEPGQAMAIQLFRFVNGWGTQNIPKRENNLSAQETQNWGLLLLQP